MDGLTDSKTEKVAAIIKQIYPQRIEKLLVVGCGTGIEAAILARELEAHVIGIDISESFDPRAKELVDLRTGDATNLQFDPGEFDFVFSYHALEHISDPMAALREMHRVLKTGGGYWIGTPNRTRLVGYIGSKEGTFGERIRWNLTDYKARLTGKFRNEYGAHAGFSAGELDSMLSVVFAEVADVTRLYFTTVYERLGWPVRVLTFGSLSRLVFPSVYFSGRK